MEMGPPEHWVAIAVDRRLETIRSALGHGATGPEAEMNALAHIGATPQTMRAVLALPLPDEGA
jgi:hypothetical protein